MCLREQNFKMPNREKGDESNKKELVSSDADS